MRNRIDKNETVAHTALEISNRNEQYSRENNIKFMGVKEEENENEEGLIKQLNHIIDTKAGVKIDEKKIVVIHRIPEKSGMPMPILVNVANTSEKSKIMRKRKPMKLVGYRLI